VLAEVVDELDLLEGVLDERGRGVERVEH
jgi:hypothetical protein